MTAASAAPGPPARVFELDILRGVAILLVLGAHPVYDARYAGALRSIATLWQRAGWTGVDLFFVLSGFLVGGLLFRELRTTGRLDVARFLVRRALRIYPVFLAFVAYLIVWVWQARPGETPWGAVCFLWPLYLTLQNYLGSPRFHLWSLAVEEHFYLTLPLVLWLLAGGGRRWVRAVPAIALTLMVGCLWLRVRHTLGPGYNPVDYHMWTKSHFRLDGLAFGVLLAYWHHLAPETLAWVRRAAWPLLGLGLALITPAIAVRYDTSRFTPTVGLTLLYLGYGCILLALLYRRAPGAHDRGLGGHKVRPYGILGRGIAAIGVASYPIYLWHFDLAHGPLLRLVDSRFFWPLGRELGWAVASAAYILLAAATGAVINWLVEKPTLRLRDRWLPPRARAVATADEDSQRGSKVSSEREGVDCGVIKR